MNLQQKIRKNQNCMVISGNMLRFFGGWVVLKTLLYVALNNAYIERAIRMTGGRYADNSWYLVVVDIAILLLSIMTSMIYFYIAKCAIEEGKKIKKHKCYFVVLILLLLFSVMGLLLDISMDDWSLVCNAILNLFADVAIALILVQLIYSTVFLRKQAAKWN